MSTELELLGLLASDRSLFLRVRRHIKDGTLSKEASTILKEVGDYFISNAHENSIDWDKFILRFLATHKFTLAEKDVYRDICDNISNVVLPLPTPTDDVIKHYIKLDYATHIMDTALRITEGDPKHTMEDIGQIVRDYHKETGRSLLTSAFVPRDISALVKKVLAGGLEWRLDCLNQSLGPLREGDFIILGARPETGKTTFIASEVTHFAPQITSGRPIIWVNNEEKSDKVQLRCIQSCLGMTLLDVLADEPAAMAKYDLKMGAMKRDALLITEKDRKNNNIRYLSGLFDEMNPALIVFDQLDKVHGYEKELREDLRLGKLYEWARDLADNSIVIAVSQVNASAAGERWIYPEQLRGSATDKAGEADAIITMGRVLDPTMEKSRFFHVPKNKLFGGTKCVPAYKHGYFECTIEEDLARFSWAGASGKV